MCLKFRQWLDEAVGVPYDCTDDLKILGWVGLVDDDVVISLIVAD